MLNWPRDNNHFNSSGEIFTPLRKFYFSDKNQEVHDSNDTDSLLAHAMSRGVSSIIEGLYPISLTDGNTIGISYGSFITSSTDVLDNSSLETTERYQKLNTSNMSVIKVGKIFDEPIQVRTAGYLHLPQTLKNWVCRPSIWYTGSGCSTSIFKGGSRNRHLRRPH